MRLLRAQDIDSFSDLYDIIDLDSTRATMFMDWIEKNGLEYDFFDYVEDCYTDDGINMMESDLENLEDDMINIPESILSDMEVDEELINDFIAYSDEWYRKNNG